MDDFRGSFCKIEPFPILESVREELENRFIEKSKTLMPTIKNYQNRNHTNYDYFDNDNKN